MADDDNFDIDIYGDDTTQDYQGDTGGGEDVKLETRSETLDNSFDQNGTNGGYQANEASQQNGSSDTAVKQEQVAESNELQDFSSERQQIASTGGSTANQLQPPKQAPVQQGVKRKNGSDDRPVDQGATSALLISDLNWWTNEDDVRGWTNQAGCEDELKEISFNEHKVNGKSKGQVFIEFQSPQAATSVKHKIESFGDGKQYTKKYSSNYHPPHQNPFKTLPKDNPGRNNRNQQSSQGGNFNSNQSFNNRGNFGGRGNFNRGGMGGNMGFQNRGGFQSGGGGFNQGGMGGNMGMGNMGGGFQGGMGGMGGGMNNFGGGFNRGGMMGGGMRGGMGNRGRGGMGMGMNPGMMGGTMGGMMPNMGMGMGMGNMGMGGMGMQGNFGAQTHFNPAFFGAGGNANSAGGSGDGGYVNPHGQKRQRQGE